MRASVMSTLEETLFLKKEREHRGVMAVTVIMTVTAKHRSLVIIKNTGAIPYRALPSHVAPRTQPPGFPLAERSCWSIQPLSRNGGWCKELQTLHMQSQTRRRII